MTRTPMRRTRHAPWSGYVVVGIDPSLTATGIAVSRGGVSIHTEAIHSEPGRPRPYRLLQLRTRLRELLVEYEPMVVAMEAETFGMPHQAGEQGHVQGVLQTAIWEFIHRLDGHPRVEDHGCHFLAVNVAHVKKWLGAKQKNEVLLQVYKHYGAEFADHNVADAYAIGVIADTYLALQESKLALETLTKPQREVLTKLALGGYPWEAPPRPKPRRKRAHG